MLEEEKLLLEERVRELTLQLEIAQVVIKYYTTFWLRNLCVIVFMLLPDISNNSKLYC